MPNQDWEYDFDDAAPVNQQQSNVGGQQQSHQRRSRNKSGNSTWQQATNNNQQVASGTSVMPNVAQQNAAYMNNNNGNNDPFFDAYSDAYDNAYGDAYSDAYSDAYGYAGGDGGNEYGYQQPQQNGSQQNNNNRRNGGNGSVPPTNVNNDVLDDDDDDKSSIPKPLKALLALLVCVIISIVVEVGVFNMYHWASMLNTSEEQTLEYTDYNIEKSVNDDEYHAAIGMPQTVTVYDELDNLEISSLSFHIEASAIQRNNASTDTPVGNGAADFEENNTNTTNSNTNVNTNAENTVTNSTSNTNVNENASNTNSINNTSTSTNSTSNTDNVDASTSNTTNAVDTTTNTSTNSSGTTTTETTTDEANTVEIEPALVGNNTSNTSSTSNTSNTAATNSSTSSSASSSSSSTNDTNNQETAIESSPIHIRIDISDSGQSQSTYRVAMLEIAEGNGTDVVLPISAYGYVKQIVITAWDDNGNEIQVSNLTTNPEIPLTFEIVRVIALSLVLFIIWVLRPSSSVWKRKHIEYKYAIVAPIMAVALLIPLYGWGTDDVQDTWGTYVSGALDQYAELAKSIVDDGDFTLNEETPEWLDEMDSLSAGEDRLTGDNNVYDPTARDAAEEEAKREAESAAASASTSVIIANPNTTNTDTTTNSSAGGSYSATGSSSANDLSTEEITQIDGYKLDSAYYEGAYYVYFGVVPCLIAFVPFYMITGTDLGNTLAIFPALLWFAVASYLLITSLVRRFFRQASCGAVILAYCGVILSSLLVASIACPMFYNIPVVFALSLAVTGSWLVIESVGLRDKHKFISSTLLAILGALLLAASIGCRPQVGLVLAVVGIWYIVRVIRSGEHRISGITLPALIIIAVIVGLLLYNQVRFGSFFDFGANYNLTGNDMTLRGSSLERALEGLWWYLFGVPELSLVYPYLTSEMPAVGFYGKTTLELFCGGLLISAPFLLAGIGLLFSRAIKKETKVMAGALMTLAIVLTAFDAEGAGVLARYLQDFGSIAGFAFALILLAYDHGRTVEDEKIKRLREVASEDENSYQNAEPYPYNVGGFIRGAFETAKARYGAAGLSGKEALEAIENIDDETEINSKPTYRSSYGTVSILLLISMIFTIFYWVSTMDACLINNDNWWLSSDNLKAIFDFWGAKIL